MKGIKQQIYRIESNVLNAEIMGYEPKLYQLSLLEHDLSKFRNLEYWYAVTLSWVWEAQGLNDF